MKRSGSENRAARSDLSSVWTLWLPVLGAAVLALTLVAWRPAFRALTYKEGPIEWATVLVALVGAAAAMVAFRRRRRLPDRRLGWWLLIFAAGMIYIAGEESSWGQHLLNPRLPGHAENVKTGGLTNIDPRSPGAATGAERRAVRERLNWLQRRNDQSETNLHNLPGFWGDLFGKLPKQLIEHGSIIVCVIIPLFLAGRLKLHDRSRPAHWLMPTTATTAAALIAFLMPWPRRVANLFVDEAPVYLRLSEPQEFYLVLTMALYAGSIAARLRPEDESAKVPAVA
jgi:hypothetical protein